MHLGLAKHPGSAPTATVRDRLLQLRSDLERVCAAAGRDPAAVGILGVTKTQPQAAVEAAIAAGLADIGENYLQEARPKYAALPPVRKHYIGHIQTNKARGIVETFDIVQSVDRLAAGQALAKAAMTLGKAPGVLVQVNISPAERFGVAPEHAERLADELRGLGLRVDGVMAIGPNGAGHEELQRAFTIAARTFGRVGGATLSLGMSADWELAVAAGSTLVRLGTTLFGARSSI